MRAIACCRLLAVFAALSCAALPSGARAQAIDMSSGGPVEVTARGGFEWRDAEHVVIAEGDARAVRGEVTVLADRLLAFYRKKAGAAPAAPVAKPAAGQSPVGGLLGGGDGGGNEIFRLEAQGHVRILTKTDEAVGDKAVYDMDQAVMVMTGRALKLTTPQQVMTARDSLEYWAQKRMAVGRGEAVVVTADARRLAADTLVAYLAPPDATPAAAPPGSPEGAGKLERVEAFGNLEVRTATDTVRGDRGVYVAATGIARVVGHVRITHGQNQINGPAADVNMQTGVAHILAGEGARVQGLIVPEDAKKAAPPVPASPVPASSVPAPAGARRP